MSQRTRSFAVCRWQRPTEARLKWSVLGDGNCDSAPRGLICCWCSRSGGEPGAPWEPGGHGEFTGAQGSIPGGKSSMAGAKHGLRYLCLDLLKKRSRLVDADDTLRKDVEELEVCDRTRPPEVVRWLFACRHSPSGPALRRSGAHSRPCYR